MSLSNWLRKFLSGRDSRLEEGGPVDPQATIDLPEPPARANSGTPTKLLVGVVSAVGNHREHNEDNYYIPGIGTLPDQGSTPPNGPTKTGFGTTLDDSPRLSDKSGSTVYPVDPNNAPQPIDPQPIGNTGLFIVADGMGGQLGGEVASKMAVELIPRELVNRLPSAADESTARAAIRDAVSAANREVLAISHVNTEVSNLGTTVVLLFFRGDRVYVANFGDSRAYRLRGDRLELLTEDHTLAKALIKVGTIAPEEEERHRFRNVLYLYLGCAEAREGPEVRPLDVRCGDRFLLCSDGLTGVVRDEGLCDILRRDEHPQRAAERLVNLALANLSRDNVTAVVIHAV